MTNIELPYFGQINFTQLNEYYATKTVYEGLTIALDLNFKNKYMSEAEAENIKHFLNSIAAYDNQNKTEIIKDFNNEGEVKDYINFYFDELDEEDLNGIVDFKDLYKPKEEQLLSKLRLIRVGLYPDGKFGAENYGVFDYSIDIDGEPCNQLLVVNTNQIGKLEYITWES